MAYRPLPNHAPAGLGTTIFADMSELAAGTGSVDLGQGFPDTDHPATVAEAARAMADGRGNRCRPPGLPDPRRAIAEHQRRFHGLEYDPENDVVVTTGAAEALAAALPGLLEPVDAVTTLAALPRLLRRPRRHGRSRPRPGRPAPAGVLTGPGGTVPGRHTPHTDCCCSTRRRRCRRPSHD